MSEQNKAPAVEDKKKDVKPKLNFFESLSNENITNKINSMADSIPNKLMEMLGRVNKENEEKEAISNKDKINIQSPEVMLKYFNILSFKTHKSSETSFYILLTILALLIFARMLDLYPMIEVPFYIGFGLYTIITYVWRILWKKMQTMK